MKTTIAVPLSLDLILVRSCLLASASRAEQKSAGVAPLLPPASQWEFHDYWIQ